MAGISAASTTLRFTANALPFFGRSLAASLGSMLVIPAPWLVTWYNRWLFGQVEVGGRATSFEGEARQIWLPYMLLMLFGYAGFVPAAGGRHVEILQLLLMPVNLYLFLLIVRWTVRNWRLTADRSLSFQGSYLPLFGYQMLLLVTSITVILPAWVLAALLRWVCRNIVAEGVTLRFEGSGWQILWRTFACVLACILILPIPWITRWLVAWYFEQIAVDGFCAADQALEGAADAPLAGGDDRGDEGGTPPYIR